uniref:C-type lectin domain family 3 member A n=1 Tax=Pavo cristatus TaxID=9049 RepID=A0A8C9FFQ7_PAVCR
MKRGPFIKTSDILTTGLSYILLFKSSQIKFKKPKLKLKTPAHKKCYLISEGTKHFHEANEDCIAKGGTLAIPRNSDEMNTLRDYGKSSMPGGSEFWLGVNDMLNEGKFVDVNGMALQYFNWDRAQPNGGKRENCVFFSAQGKWVDEVCRTAKRYICEFLIP